jgi:hypothetical protein
MYIVFLANNNNKKKEEVGVKELDWGGKKENLFATRQKALKVKRDKKDLMRVERLPSLYSVTQLLATILKALCYCN